MGRAVLDTSAVIAVLREEPGREALTAEILAESVISAVNMADVQSVLVRDGMKPEDAWEDASLAVSLIISFTPEMARLAGSLIAQTRPFGLSLGDRACLALALTLDAPVYTADRAWKTLDVGCQIHVIR